MNYVIVDHPDDEFIYLDTYANDTPVADQFKEFTLLIDADKYLADIFATYAHDFNKVYEQMEKDVPRCIVTINGIRITDAAYLKHYCVLHSAAALLFTQATLAYPMEKLIKFYNIGHNTVLADAGTHLYIGVKGNIITIYKKLRVVELLFMPDGTYVDMVNRQYINVELEFLLDRCGRVFAGLMSAAVVA